MPITMMGLVAYEDDGVVFRWVWPSIDDAELDDPQWTTMGCDPARVAVLRKVPIGELQTDP